MKIRLFTVLMTISALLLSCELFDEDQAVDQEDFNTDQYFYAGLENGMVLKINPIEEEIWSEQIGDEPITAIERNRNGNMIIGTEDGYVHKLDDDGNRIWEYDEQEDFISGIAIDDENNTYTLGGDGLHKISPDGEYVWRYSDAGGGSEGVVAFQEEYLLTAAGNAIHKLDTSGQQQWVYDDPDAAVSEIRSNEGDLIIVATQGDGLHQIDSEGAPVRQIYSSGWIDVVGIDQDQNMYIGTGSDENSGGEAELVKLRENGSQVWSEPWERDGEFRQIQIDDEGFVFPVGSGLDEIRAYNRNAEKIWTYQLETSPVSLMIL